MNYSIARPLIQTGDLILWRGNSLLSRCIELCSEYSHASLVVRINEYFPETEAVLVVEAVGTGLQFRRLSYRMEKFNGEVYWLPVECEKDNRFAIARYALDQLFRGVKYDYLGLLANIFKRPKINPTQWYCSEFAWAVLANGGVVELGEEAPQPGDLPGRLGGTVKRLTKEFFHG